IWVAMNLILAGQPTGAWILALPAVASAVTVPLARGALRRPLPAPVTVVVPRGEPAEPGQGPVIPRHPPEPAGRVNRARLPQLANGACAVALDSGFWDAAMRALAGQPREQGGVALISRHQDVLLILGAIFPKQMQASMTHCEFSTVDVERVRLAL